MNVEIVNDKEVTVIPEKTEYSSLIKMAIDKDLDTDKLEKIIALHNDMKMAQAKEDFEFHFAEMQKEFTPMKRSKKTDKGKYSPIDEFQKKYDPIITAHGFSYSWNENQLADGWIDIVLTISGYGYSKQNHKAFPPYEPDKGSSSGKPIMNVLQAEGVRSTYGYRYTFKAGFGITETDEDTDGNMLNYEDGVYYADYIKRIRICDNLDELAAEFKLIWQDQEISQEGKKILSIEKDKKKRELSNGPKN